MEQQASTVKLSSMSTEQSIELESLAKGRAASRKPTPTDPTPAASAPGWTRSAAAVAARTTRYYGLSPKILDRIRDRDPCDHCGADDRWHPFPYSRVDDVEHTSGASSKPCLQHHRHKGLQLRWLRQSGRN